jgi:predicted HNH restriction endonuclease
MKFEVKSPPDIVPFFIVHSGKETELLTNKSSSDFLSPFLDIDILNDFDEFPEGKVKTHLHKNHERNVKAVMAKKKAVLQDTGKLLCEVCDFDFAEFYGDYGYGFTECHHTIPVYQLSEGHKTKLSELSIVCSNCHRILHRSRPMLSVQALRKIIKSE